MSDALDCSVFDWIERFRKSHPMSVREVALQACEHWSLDAGRLVHQTGGFFSVVGFLYEGSVEHLQGYAQPMIDQPEIGILGFVVRKGDRGWQWLLHAKAEPGNVGGTQVGPTVQATYSNYMRLHGGQPTAMLETFLQPETNTRILADVEQSEQGDRFLGKYNRNMQVVVPPDFEQTSDERWQWFTASCIKDALHIDYLINTDARSVIFCADWTTLTDYPDSEPFGTHQGSDSFGRSLSISWRHDAGVYDSSHAREILKNARSASKNQWHLVDLQRLPNWVWSDFGVYPQNPDGDPVVKYYSIRVPGREISDWCQPLLANRRVGRVVLLCSIVDDCLKFWIRLGFEPGLKESVQWAPSFVSGEAHSVADGVLEVLNSPRGQVVRAQVMQSDEGGRFMSSVARYQVIEIDQELAAHLDPGEDQGVWVSLFALKQLANEKGLLTNELRSVASLLLKWC